MVNRDERTRAKLLTKLFTVPPTGIGKTVTLIKYLSPTYNDRGELENAYTQSTSSLVVVPYNIIDSSRQQEVVGDADTGLISMAVPWDTDVALKDDILMEGDYWTINLIEKNYLPNNVVTILSLVKKVA